MSIRREGLAVFAAGYLVHAALALVMRVPIVMYDEYGYFATARRLVGEGQATHLRYHPGYAFVLMPAFLVTTSSGAAYHVSLLVVNGLLGALTTLIAWHLVRVFAPDASPRIRLLAAAIVALYPSWLLYTDLTWSENLLVPIAAAVVLLAGRLARGAPPWVVLGYGVLAGCAYLSHPRGLAVTGSAVLVGLVVLPVAGRLLRAAVLLVSAGTVTVLTPSITRWTTDSAGWGKDSFFRGFHVGDTPNLLATIGGHLFYLAAATYGLAPLGLYVLVGLIRREGVRSERGAVALAALVAAAAMLFVSGMFWHNQVRSDQMIYGRYNEATLLPILVAGVVALATVTLDRRRILVMLVPIAVLWTIPQVASDAALRNSDPVTFNILGVAPVVALFGVQPVVIAAAHGLAAAVLILIARERSRFALPALCAGLALFGLGVEVGLFRTGSRDRAGEQLIASKLVQIESVVPPDDRCVSFDRATVDVFAASSYRYRIDGWRFAQPGEKACADLFLIRTPAANVLERVPGARIVAREQRGTTKNALWVRPGPLQDALAKAGLLAG